MSGRLLSLGRLLSGGRLGCAFGGFPGRGCAVGGIPGRSFAEGGGLPGRLSGWFAGGFPPRFATGVGCAGRPGGACLTRACAAALAGCILCNCCRGIGTPGCRASVWSRAENAGGGGGGVVFTTTVRCAIAGGGAATRPAVFACAPSTA